MSVALAPVADSQNVFGRQRSVDVDVTLDNSYTTGGYSITASQVGMKTIFGAQIVGVGGTLANSGGLHFAWDSTNSKLVAFYPTGGGTASPAAIGAPIVTTGASTASAVDATTPNITPGIGKQVLNTTDLSSVVVRVRFLGY